MSDNYDRCDKCGTDFHGATALAGDVVDGKLLCPLCIQKLSIDQRQRGGNAARKGR